MPEHINAFINKTKKPTDSELTEALGPGRTLWDALIDAAKELDVVDQEWNSFSPKYGWSLRLKKKKRNILYLSPSHGSFLASLILGDRAMEAARRSRLSKSIMKTLSEATKYPEGTAIRVNVKQKKDIETILKLLPFKLEN